VLAAVRQAIDRSVIIAVIVEFAVITIGIDSVGTNRLLLDYIPLLR
jgi:hypothetical protein